MDEIGGFETDHVVPTLRFLLRKDEAWFVAPWVEQKLRFSRSTWSPFSLWLMGGLFQNLGLKDWWKFGICQFVEHLILQQILSSEKFIVSSKVTVVDLVGLVGKIFQKHGAT